MVLLREIRIHLAPGTHFNAADNPDRLPTITVDNITIQGSSAAGTPTSTFSGFRILSANVVLKNLVITNLVWLGGGTATLENNVFRQGRLQIHREGDVIHHVPHQVIGNRFFAHAANHEFLSVFNVQGVVVEQSRFQGQNFFFRSKTSSSVEFRDCDFIRTGDSPLTQHTANATLARQIFVDSYFELDGVAVGERQDWIATQGKLNRNNFGFSRIELRDSNRDGDSLVFQEAPNTAWEDNHVFDGSPQIYPDQVLETSGENYVDIASLPHNIGSGDFTWALWVKSDRLSHTYEAVLGNKQFSPGMYTRMGNEWGIYWSGRKKSGVTLELNRWYHLAVTRKNDIVRFYTNGVESERTYSVTTAMENGRFTIGQQGTHFPPDTLGWTHKGQIDDVAVYRSALENISDTSPYDPWPRSCLAGRTTIPSRFLLLRQWNADRLFWQWISWDV